MAEIHHAVTLYEGQSLTVTFPGYPGDAYNVQVFRYTWNLDADLTASDASDYVATSYSGPVTGTSQTIVTRTDNVVEGDEYFDYVYDLFWQTGPFATSGGDKHVWDITLKDARNLTGSASSNVLAGTPGWDKLNGAGGNDTLTGFAGVDVLTGGTGADRFVFREAGPTNADRITDFLHGTDKIAFDDAVFTRLVPNPAGGLKVANLRVGSAALDSNDYIVYDPGTGRLYYDPDGNGVKAAKLVATLVGSPDTISATDFLVI